jgi:hypothetical protein
LAEYTFGTYMLILADRKIGASREQALREREAEEGDDAYENVVEGADEMDL